VLRGAELVRVAEDIGGKLSFHDCTLLLTRRGRAPYLVRCVAEIAVGCRMLSQAQPAAQSATQSITAAHIALVIRVYDAAGNVIETHEGAHKQL
jgi:hypothetical protein